MKYQLMQTLKSHFLANIEKHKANIEIMLNNPQGIPTIQELIKKICHYLVSV